MLACFLFSDFALNEERLSDMRKGQIVVEFRRSPDFSDFDSAVIRGRTINEVRFLAVFKVVGDVLEKSGMIVFHGEVVMSVSFFDEISGKLFLGQEGICRDCFSFNSDGIEHWGGGLDFVGAFDLLFRYGDGAYFFWV